MRLQPVNHLSLRSGTHHCINGTSIMGIFWVQSESCNIIHFYELQEYLISFGNTWIQLCARKFRRKKFHRGKFRRRKFCCKEISL